MKIRQGFVSNSSSSSFYILGKHLTWEQVKENANELITKKQLHGHSFSNPRCKSSSDYFLITQKMFDIYKEHANNKQLDFYQVYKELSLYEQVTKENMPEEPCNIIRIEQSIDSTSNLREFSIVYIDQEEIPAEVQQIFNELIEIEKKCDTLRQEQQNKENDLTEKGYFINWVRDEKVLVKIGDL